MNCKKCNSFIDPGSYFCGECGTVILENVVEGMKRKDEVASRIFIENTQQKLYYTALSIIKDASLAEDIVQETYLTAFNSFDSLMDDTKILSWIMRITVNKCKNYLSSKQNNMFSDFSSLENVDDIKFEDTIEDERMEFVPDKRFNLEQIKEGVNAILNELPENQRLAIFLYYLDEFKVKEISEIMNVPEGTVKSLLNYGRKTIKNKIEELRKNNKSFYSVAPMPFLSWFLEEQAKAIQVPTSMEQSIIKSLALSGASKAAATTSAASSASVKAAVSMGARTISAKMIVGITAGVVGIGGATGYTLSQTVFKSEPAQNTQGQSVEISTQTPSEESSYKVVDSAIGNFDFAPISLDSFGFRIQLDETDFDNTVYKDGEYYIASVDGRFGLLDNNNQWIVEPTYEFLYCNSMDKEFRATPYFPGQVDGSDNVPQDQYGIYHGLYAGVGGPQSIYIEEIDGELVVYCNTYDYEVGKMVRSPYKGEKYFYYDSGNMAWGTYEDQWYLINGEGALYGPYDLNEIPCFEAYLFQGGANLNLNASFALHSMFYCRENEKYRIYNLDASKKVDVLFDEVEPLSRTWMKAKYDDEIIYIDNNLNQYICEDAQELSEPLNDKSYAKIDNEWKYIEINQAKGE